MRQYIEILLVYGSQLAKKQTNLYLWGQSTLVSYLVSCQSQVLRCTRTWSLQPCLPWLQSTSFGPDSILIWLGHEWKLQLSYLLAMQQCFNGAVKNGLRCCARVMFSGVGYCFSFCRCAQPIVQPQSKHLVSSCPLKPRLALINAVPARNHFILHIFIYLWWR